MSQFEIIGTPAMRVFKRYVMPFSACSVNSVRDNKSQYLIPRWIAAAPNMSFFTLISLKPAKCMIFFNSYAV